MTKRLWIALLVLATVPVASSVSRAAINRPAEQDLGNIYEECTVQCREFVDAQACWQFRKANLLCTEKKKSTWPIFTARCSQK